MPTDTIALLASTLGVGFLSGFRLYATVLGLGLALRFNLFNLHNHFANLDVLAHTYVLGAAGALCLVEFLADKVPWIDSAWDSVHSIIRPVAGALLAGTVAADLDPVPKMVLSLLAGGIALSTHSAKAATRLAVNHSPEPFSNVALSVAEDAAMPLALWVVSAHPLLFLGFLAVFLACFALVAPVVFRMVRLEFAALGGLLRSWFGSGAAAPNAAPSHLEHGSKGLELWSLLNGRFETLPPGMATVGAAVGVKCAATKSVRGLKRSIGYLTISGDQALFVTRRMFRKRTYAMPLAQVQQVQLRSGIFLDELGVVLPDRTVRFDVFKTATAATRVASAPALSS